MAGEDLRGEAKAPESAPVVKRAYVGWTPTLAGIYSTVTESEDGSLAVSFRPIRLERRARRRG